jgi:hypothetical protein
MLLKIRYMPRAFQKSRISKNLAYDTQSIFSKAYVCIDFIFVF